MCRARVGLESGKGGFVYVRRCETSTGEGPAKRREETGHWTRESDKGRTWKQERKRRETGVKLSVPRPTERVETSAEGENLKAPMQ